MNLALVLHILFIGNSITRCPAYPEIGWNGNHGMAASAPDSDYVSHVLSSLGASGSRFGASHWEAGFWRDSVSAVFAPTDTVSADLIVVFLGDYVRADSAMAHDFQSHYASLLRNLVSAHPSAQLLAVTKFWPDPAIDSMIQAAAGEYPVANLLPLAYDTLNYAYTERVFQNSAVGNHPGDQGHRKIAEIILASLTAASVEPPVEPRSTSLAQNYPNPFNPSTAISYLLSAGGFVTLKVYDVLGREVATLVNGFQRKGLHTMTFNASGVASGMYFLALSADNRVQVRKMVVAR